jgi:hypothetical protein
MRSSLIIIKIFDTCLIVGECGRLDIQVLADTPCPDLLQKGNFLNLAIFKCVMRIQKCPSEYQDSVLADRFWLVIYSTSRRKNMLN